MLYNSFCHQGNYQAGLNFSPSVEGNMSNLCDVFISPTTFLLNKRPSTESGAQPGNDAIIEEIQK